MSVATLGRVTQPPHPTVLDLLYRPQLDEDRSSVLPYLLRIDAAHVVMLARRRLLRTPTAAALLGLNQELQARVRAGEDVLGSPPVHRGLYLLYERLYVDRLGPEIGGAAHLARSRNDINAAVARMRARDALLWLLGDSVSLFEAMADRAQHHAATVMSGFTHMQPAQPSTFGHYLAAVLSELVRSGERLTLSFDLVNLSPLGAAAGFGTSIPVDPGMVAELLGFSGAIENSADAVASRDYVVGILSGLAILGATLSRLGTDLQSWSSAAFGFLDWPDALVSTSSIMPQKRNAFPLEVLRGRCVRPFGALVSTLGGLKNVSFGNSVEVSAEATSHLWPALVAIDEALRLARLLVESVQAREERMRAFLDGKETTMTALADHLATRHGLPFRTAHEAVARLAGDPRGSAEPANVKALLEATVAELTGQRIGLRQEEIESLLDPRANVERARFGGGPAPAVVRKQVAGLRQRIRAMQREIEDWRHRLGEAEESLQKAVAAVREAALTES